MNVGAACALREALTARPAVNATLRLARQARALHRRARDVQESLDQELYADFGALRAERGSTDQDIEGWAQGLSDEQLAGKLRFTSMLRPEPREFDLWLLVTHFFNHQTHHRGQVTALLSQLGRDYGVTDLLRMPEDPPRR